MPVSRPLQSLPVVIPGELESTHWRRERANRSNDGRGLVDLDVCATVRRAHVLIWPPLGLVRASRAQGLTSSPGPSFQVEPLKNKAVQAYG